MEDPVPQYPRKPTWRHAALIAAWLPLAAFATDFGNKQPSVADFIEHLKGDESGAVGEGVATRSFSLRPGAASQATAAPPAGQVAAPATDPSVSIQVKFDFGSDLIAGDSRQTVQNLAAALQSDALGGRAFLIVGHTDAVGSAAYNQRLSERRAQAVKSFLIQQGVQADRLQTIGRGFTQLLDNRNPRSATNRRVEVVARRL